MLRNSCYYDSLNELLLNFADSNDEEVLKRRFRVS